MSISRIIIRLEVCDDSTTEPEEDTRRLLLFNYTDIEFSAIDYPKMAEKEKLTTKSSKPKRQVPVKDYHGRREPSKIEVESYVKKDSDKDDHLDEKANNKTVSTEPQIMELTEDGKTKQSIKTDRSTDKTGKIHFFSGNPSVEITKGIIHIFKENQMTSLTDDVPRSEMICMLAVPASLTIHDIVQFTAPSAEGIELLRIIRDASPNQFMVLVKFKNASLADEFYSEYNGKVFNSIENQQCYLAYVARVELTKTSEGGYLVMPGVTELPVCHICLERMDEAVDGIITILCNHSFHGSCLYKWGDISCPVCRYCQTPEMVEDNKCYKCGVQESLWICLVCGVVGCGRYVEAHAHEHFKETQHTYALQVGQNKVWDYAGDNYVHRLMQTKGDGKMVEWDHDEDGVSREEKLDSITLEYTYLLTNQLESQKAFYEERISRIEQEALQQRLELESSSKKKVEECEKSENKVQNLLKEKSALEKKISQLSSKLHRTNQNLIEEKEMNSCLRSNQNVWQDKVKSLEQTSKVDKEKYQKEIVDLQEQLRDVMFFLEAQDKIKQSPANIRQEIQDGQISVGSASGTSESRTTSKRGKKKR
ncbi:BRCA1-associated protein-like [Antedon mediterranea]|uniref:BRCA1-associated protein-like n=1 Tax=Antedon mediterranea TaxID=105859 RepID=UPI003AF78A41